MLAMETMTSNAKHLGGAQHAHRITDQVTPIVGQRDVQFELRVLRQQPWQCRQYDGGSGSHAQGHVPH
jgi:hypothetical protein